MDLFFDSLLALCVVVVLLSLFRESLSSSFVLSNLGFDEVFCGLASCSLAYSMSFRACLSFDPSSSLLAGKDALVLYICEVVFIVKGGVAVRCRGFSRLQRSATLSSFFAV
ncbi:predicted protein [Arabidopsis lyrata subsp. lyrata]|uniref:Predicted protein n=1 Tax=Arabidopsis lyrata subsp. lyrata TaxID=81972 RepID=D7LBT6_ARALL|nr:predicted protein [Arabidopsis lyrata subsp. lyrata]